MQSGLADSHVYSNLMLILKDNGEYERAEELCRNVIILNPSNKFALNNLAYLCFDKADYKNTIRYAKDALKIDPSMLQSLKLHAFVYSIQNNHEKTQIYEKRAVSCGANRKELREIIQSYL